jgi:hypothetical protein
MEPLPIASPQETIEALLGRSQRAGRAVPIRRTFVQQGSQRRPLPGPLASLVKRRDERALDLYLLLHAVASAPPWNVAEAAAVWARTLGLLVPGSGESAVSKVWRRLEQRGLVARGRIRRQVSITLLDESGSGKPYTHPGSTRDPYFQLSFRYWTAPENWHRELPFAAKSMLLIALSLPTKFILPLDRVHTWYGVSADTAHRGLTVLRAREILHSRKEFKKAPLAPLGYTEQLVYSLEGPFARARRTA